MSRIYKIRKILRMKKAVLDDITLILLIVLIVKILLRVHRVNPSRIYKISKIVRMKKAEQDLQDFQDCQDEDGHVDERLPFLILLILLNRENPAYILLMETWVS